MKSLRPLLLLCGVLGFSISCHRVPKRFATLEVIPAPESALDLSQVLNAGDRQMLREEILRSYREAIIYGKKPHSLFKAGQTVAADSQLVTFGVSVRPAPPTPGPPSSAFSEAKENVQAEIVKLFRKKAENDPGKALGELLQLINVKSGVPTGDLLHPRIEVTFSHTLNLPGDWDRFQYVAIYLVLHDKDVRVVDTNQIESVMRDIEFGTLTESTEVGAKAGVGKVPFVEGGKGEAGAEISGTLSEKLERKLREQLNFRSASIEARGRIFRLTQRSSVENAVPSMVRQILTLEYSSPGPLLTLKPVFEKNELKDLRLIETPFPYFEGTQSNKLSADGRYEVKATLVVVAVVRRVANDAGIRTVVEDDDRVRYHTEVVTLQPVVLDRIPIRHWHLIAKKTKDPPRLYVNRGDSDKPTLVEFLDREDALSRTDFFRH